MYFDFLVISGYRLGGGWFGHVFILKVHMVLVDRLRVGRVMVY